MNRVVANYVIGRQVAQICQLGTGPTSFKTDIIISCCVVSGV